MYYLLPESRVHAINGVHRHSWLLIPVGTWMRVTKVLIIFVRDQTELQQAVRSIVL